MGRQTELVTNTTPKIIRKQLRQRRLRLTKRQRRQASFAAMRQLSHFDHPALRKKNAKIGLFVDAFGELPTQALIDWATKRHYQIYLPVVKAPNKALVFVKLTHTRLTQARLAKHPLGMRQPAKGAYLSADQLDILFLPLVAVDKTGNRMGMGGGFYDRTLAKTKTKPLKIAWAYDFQLVDHLTVNPWDIKVDAAVLPSRLYLFRRYLTEQKGQTKEQADMPNTPLPISITKSATDILPENIKLLDVATFDSNTPDTDTLDTDTLDTATLNSDTDELTPTDIASVINPKRLEQLLQQANTFIMVNSDQLDEFK